MVDLKREYTPQKVDTLIQSIRGICQNLKPQILLDLGLGAALESLVFDLQQSSTLHVTVSIEKEFLAQVPEPYTLPIFRITQELLNNCKRHAQATNLTLTLSYNPNESNMLRLQVHDDGKGFNPNDIQHGMGFKGIQERVQVLEGTFLVQSYPKRENTTAASKAVPSGTNCIIAIPVHLSDKGNIKHLASQSVS
jgi:signal transduction histidine kinase